MRDRLDRDHGSHANQLIWEFNSTTGSSTPGAALTRKAFLTMDAWLAAIEADASSDPIETKVVRDKPAGATDFCLTTIGATDANLTPALALDDPACPVKHEATPRQVAGGPVAENIFKCSLKPLNFSDPGYGAATFSDRPEGAALRRVPRWRVRLESAGRRPGSGESLEHLRERAGRNAARRGADLGGDPLATIPATGPSRPGFRIR